MRPESPGRLRVLVADDHPGVVKAVSRLLALEYDVVGNVADGARLLEAAQRLRPDVVVLDVNLPNVDGLRACRQLTQQYPEVKVILFTAVDDPEVKRRAFEAGAADFVHKLARVDDLLSAVERLDACRSGSVY
jgi:DNA-binding NarL/FixJ family response regulator